MSGAEFDDDLLRTAVTRKEALAALADEPHHRRDLQERLGVSKTTCHRIVRALDERGLVRRTDRGYELTELGIAVAGQVDRFEANVRLAYQLEPLLDAFETAAADLDVELFADATITRPRPDDPTAPAHRYLELFREADTVRTLDRSSFLPPLYIREIVDSVIEGAVTAEAILPTSVVRTRIEEFTDTHRRLAEAADRSGYRLYDTVPFGITLFDDRVGLRAYDDETGSVLVFADTDDPETVDWARAVYRHYRERSRPPSAVEGFPDWVPEADL